VVVAVRVGWPDQEILRGTLADIHCKGARGQGDADGADSRWGGRSANPSSPDSALYDPGKPHVLRPKARAAG
jgi:precorrin-4/cobalt-precorrin-4 C11-methyltransferase